MKASETEKEVKLKPLELGWLKILITISEVVYF